MMGVLADLARYMHARMQRAARAQLRTVAPEKPASGLCRRCGCDINSCREWGCPTVDPNESYSPGWKHTSDPGMTGLKTDYEHRRYG